MAAELSPTEPAEPLRPTRAGSAGRVPAMSELPRTADRAVRHRNARRRRRPAIYYEQVGNPAGKPMVILHGGPGGGCSVGMRRTGDPDRSTGSCCSTSAAAVAAGRTWPTTTPAGDTTPPAHLIDDIERLREHLGHRALAGLRRLLGQLARPGLRRTAPGPGQRAGAAGHLPQPASRTGLALRRPAPVPADRVRGLPRRGSGRAARRRPDRGLQRAAQRRRPGRPAACRRCLDRLGERRGQPRPGTEGPAPSGPIRATGWPSPGSARTTSATAPGCASTS